MTQRKPLTATELAILENSRPLVSNHVREFGGFERAASEWNVDRKTLSSYVSGDRRTNRRSADKLLPLISRLTADNNVGKTVPRGTGPSMTPVQRVHAEGVEQQRAWLWDYTVSVMRAIVEQADLLGAAPPRNSPAEFAARAGTQAMQYLMHPPAPAVVNESQSSLDQAELARRVAQQPAPTPEKAARAKRAQQTVMRDAAATTTRTPAKKKSAR